MREQPTRRRVGFVLTVAVDVVDAFMVRLNWMATRDWRGTCIREHFYQARRHSRCPLRGLIGCSLGLWSRAWYTGYLTIQRRMPVRAINNRSRKIRFIVMATMCAATLLVLAMSFMAPHPVAAAAESSEAKELFNGKDLTGWEGDEKIWS